MARVSVITGGASGIGHATALRLAKAGDTIVIADVNEEAMKAVADEVAALGVSVHTRLADVADEAAVDALFDGIARDVGTPDVLVNSAGLLENAQALTHVDMEEHDRIWAVNYRGTFLCCRAAARLMRKTGKGGSMILMGSINSYRPLPLPVYNPGKVAIRGLVEVLSADLGPDRIRVNAIAPGYTLTPAIKQRIEAGLRDPKAIMDMCALDHFVTPEDIAAAIHFLCSDDARAITGVTLPVDSGWMTATTYKSYPAERAD